MSVELEEALPLTPAAAGPARKAAPAPAQTQAQAPPDPEPRPQGKKKKKKKNQPGKYSQLVVETIRRLGERQGSSLARIYAEARKVAWFDQQNGRTYLKYSIKALVQNDTLLQVKGTGANGSFRLNRKKLEGPGPASGAAAAAGPDPKAKPKPAGAPKAAAPSKPRPKKDPGAGGKAKKEKKAAKPSVPKVPKGRK
ncbi:histone H1.10 [Suncus etruscus]|uniref:histone H1.10 n=1 Tax=Suncus etruscus TaxID=109475 RepID=UPI00210FB467|nr:histone H1.10 [Suncus etruscus]